MPMSNHYNLIDWVLAKRRRSHILYWLIILFSYPIYMQQSGLTFYQAFIEKLFFLPGQILATYFLLYYQLPKLIFRKRYGAFVLSFIVATYVIGVLTHGLMDYGISPLLGRENKICTAPELLIDIGTALTNAQWFYLIAWMSAGIKLIKQHYEDQQHHVQLEKEKTTAELNYLKARIHPRLLANTLDKLYDLAIQKSDDAPEVVIKLSEMLDYVLYQANDGPVPIPKELDLLEHYLSLEKLRFPKAFDWDIQNRLSNSAATIAPMLLVTLIEHVLSQTTSAHQTHIQLTLADEKNHFQIQLICQWHQRLTNTKLDFHPIKQQLQLAYPDQHQIQIHQAPHQIELQIWLPFDQKTAKNTISPEKSLTYESSH